MFVPAAHVAWLPEQTLPLPRQPPSRQHALVGEPPQRPPQPSCSRPLPLHFAWRPAINVDMSHDFNLQQVPTLSADAYADACQGAGGCHSC